MSPRPPATLRVELPDGRAADEAQPQEGHHEADEREDDDVLQRAGFRDAVVVDGGQEHRHHEGSNSNPDLAPTSEEADTLAEAGKEILAEANHGQRRREGEPGPHSPADDTSHFSMT